MAIKKKGGPKSLAGKSIASKNATTHGITASHPSSSSEKLLNQNFIDELMAYYQPESPLEKLQIERIALCRTKLSRLYQVEENKLKIHTLAQSDPKKILDELKIKGLTKGMILEIIHNKKLTLPCQLSEETLNAIMKEIDAFTGTLKVQKDLDEHFPVLVKFLLDYQSIKDTYPVERDLQLEFITQRIKRALDSGDTYRESSRILYELLDMVRSDQANAEGEIDDELDQYILNSQAKYRQQVEEKKQWKKDHYKKEPGMEELVHGRVMLQFNIFKELFKEAQSAHEHYEKYLHAKELIVNSITLPETESDLLLRYQTTWERRLSSAIGELLALQKQRI